jgi:hypothetical protein
VKRKAQNRAAQRAFRERKERYVKELESKIKQVQDAHLVATAQLVRENQQLRAIIYRLESENYALKGIPMQPYQPPPPPPSTPSIPQQRNNSNYTNIAPLLPQTASSQPPLLLPAYLSNSPSPVSQQQPVSSILQSASPSVNQMMMLASNPLQQYPMSPVISAAIQNSQHISSPTTKPISKKVSSKQSKSTPPPNNQPLEYTFSISTPASLRPNGGSTSSSKHNRGEPIELVQLYPPGGNRNHQQNSATSPAATAADASPSTSNATLQKSDLIMLSPCNHNNNFAKKALSVTSVSSNGSCSTIAPFTVNTPASAPAQDDTCSVVSDKTISTVNTQTQYKKIQQLEIDMFDCHIDTEGQLFCEKLHNEVCNDAFDRLLSEPLFDQMGKLNLSISNYPVPIVTGPMSSMNTLEEEEEEEGASSSTTGQQRTTEDKHNNDKAKENNDDKQNDTKPLDDDMTKDSKKPSSEKRLLTCPEIWFILNQHGNFHKFTTDQLCQAVKELAKCADSGPVLEEPDLYQMLTKMDQGHL